MRAIRDMLRADLPSVLTLNNANAAEVNALTGDELADLVAVAARARITDDGLGFLIALDEATPRQGPNHAWFLERRRRFLYVDRVVIAAAARRRGYARAIYSDLATIADGRPLCCEVNLQPQNAASLAFHAGLGFETCGEAEDPRNGKRVRYLIRE